MKNLLLALLVLSVFSAAAQLKPSKKDLKARLTTNAWKVIKTWDGNQEEVSSPFEWTESTISESRLAEYFGAVQISFKSGGTFSAVGLTGNNFSGKWSAKRGLSFTYKDSDDYDHYVEFDKIQLTINGFIVSGDICHDGCYAKVEFEKVK